MKIITLLSIMILACNHIFSQSIWTSKAVATIGDRIGAFGCNIGSKGYMGGGEYTTGGGYFIDWWEYDPTTNVWTQKANYTTTGNGRTRGTAFNLGTSGFIVGGKAAGTTVFNQMLRYNSLSNTWSTSTSYPGNGRWGITSFTVGNSAYVGTGTPNGVNYYGDIWEFNGAGWISRAGVASRRDAVSFSINGKGYLGCGKDLSGTGSCSDRQDFLEYDPLSNTWTSKANFPIIMSWGIGFSIGSYGYMGTGVSSGCSTLGNFYRYNPANNTWTSIAIPFARSGGFGFTIGNNGYVGGGGSNSFQELNVCSTISQNSTFENPSCNGYSDGSITVNGSGGLATYTYSFNNGVSFQSGNIMSGLSSGSFNIIVKDGSGCTTNAQLINITNPPNVNFTSSFDDVSCYGLNDGALSFIPTGGTPSYNYSIDNGISYQINSDFINLNPGVYTLVVKDVNDCISASSQITIGEPSQIIFNTQQTNLSCFESNDGEILVNANGGFGVLTYTIDGVNFQSNNNFNNLVSSNYTITVLDDANCSVSSSFINLSQPTEILFDVLTSLPTCNGYNDGTLEISPLSGGVLPLNYSLDNGVTFQTSNSFLNLISGSYPVLIEDADGCISSINNLTLNDPLPLNSPIITSSGPLEFCIGDSVILTSSIANSYNWSTSETTQSITVNNTSNATVTIFDNSGCSSTSDQVAVVVNPLPTVPTISISGDTLYSSYSSGNQWYFNDVLINGAINQSYIPTQSGNYTVEVTNSFVCSSISNPYIYSISSLNEKFSENIVSIYPNPNNGFIYIDINNLSYIEIQVINSFGEIVFQSNNNVDFIDLTNKPKGIYLLRLIDNEQTICKKIILQ